MSVHTVKTDRGSRGIAPLILTLGAPAVPTSREETPVPSQQEAGWASEPVWTFRRRKNKLPLPRIEPRTVHHGNVKTNRLLLYKVLRHINGYDAIFHTMKSARLSISLWKRVRIWFSTMDEIAKFLRSTDLENLYELIYNGSSETSKTHLHGAVTPKQAISWPPTAVQAPNLITNTITLLTK